MHNDFADWYRLVSIEPNSEVLEKRWEGVEGAAKSADLETTLHLARMLFGLPDNQEFTEKFQTFFKAADNTFPMRNNREELRVLAASAIVWVLETRQGRLGDAAALAVVCGNYREMRSPGRLAEIVTKARNHLSRRSVTVRGVGQPKSVPGLGVKIEELTASLQAAASSNNPNTVGNSVKAAFETLGNQIVKFATSVGQATKQNGEAIQVLNEKSEILWWLFGGHSRDLGHPMSDLSPSAACLVSGKELADLTVLLPGPVAAVAFLDKMLRGHGTKLPKETNLERAINEVSREWRSAWVSGLPENDISDLLPVLLAARKSLETDGVSEWGPAFKKMSGVSPRASIAPLDLAFQAYEESLLVRAIRSAE